MLHLPKAAPVWLPGRHRAREFGDAQGVWQAGPGVVLHTEGLGHHISHSSPPHTHILVGLGVGAGELVVRLLWEGPRKAILANRTVQTELTSS